MNDIALYLLEKLAAIPGIMLAFTLRAFCQAFSSDKLGDPTPRNAGRLTFNPIAHFDPIGFIFILIFGFGWCKPVPVNSRYYKHIRRDCAIQILSGPLGCIAGGFVMSFIYVLFCGIFKAELFTAFSFELGIKSFIAYMLLYSVNICIALGLFFLLPIPGFDGFRLIANFMPPKAYGAMYKLEKYGLIIWIGVILLLDYTPIGIYVFDIPIGFLMDLFMSVWLRLLFFLFI